MSTHSFILFLAALAKSECILYKDSTSCDTTADVTSLLQVENRVTHGSDRDQADIPVTATAGLLDDPPMLDAGFVGRPFVAAPTTAAGYSIASTDFGPSLGAGYYARVAKSLGPTPVHDYRAIASAAEKSLVPGKSYVNDALENNALKTAGEIEKQASSDIRFTLQEQTERQVNHDMALKAVAAAQAQTKKNIHHDLDRVEATLKERKSIVNAALEKVKKAKQNAEALKIKAQQAEHAAVLGRVVGKIEGNDAAHHAWSDYKRDLREKADARARAMARQRLRVRRQTKRNLINKQTAKLAARDRFMVDAAKAMNEAMTAKSAAAAAKTEERLEGPEGLKNRLTEEKAESAVKNYEWQVAREQDMTDMAATGQWPPGDWPIGP